MLRLHKHNKETYERLTRLFAFNDRVAVVQPTGTGKSFIILKLIADNADKRFLVLSPSVYIFKQIETHADESRLKLNNVEFLTYMKLANMNEEEIKALRCDYIVLDEFHRCGAAEWGRGIDTLLNIKAEAKVLGTSATPIRYLDSSRNMAEELFNSVYAVNMSLHEAIRRKILPLPIYVTSWYSFRGKLEQFEIRAERSQNPRLKEAMREKIRKAKRRVAKLDCGLDKVFEKHIPNKSGKYIVFCSNIEELVKIYGECDKWFERITDDIHKYSVYSHNANSEDEFKKFSEDDSDALKLLFCVDMLNEGVHIDDVSGVIMLRATQSANVFYQQLGRALACSEKALHPVIFDIVNNFETGDTAQEYYAIMEISRDGMGDDDDIEFELYDYVRDIRQILEELSETFENSWDIVYEALVEFKEKYNRFPLGTEDYDGLKLGQWCKNQRALYRQGSLSEEQIKKLEDINFPWDLNELSWFSAYEEVKKIAERLGKFPSKKDMPPELASWVQSQRSKFRSGILEEERAQLLISLGCKMKINDTAKWEDRLGQLKDFVAQNGRFPENADSFNNSELKILLTWINSQRKSYFKGTLSEDKKKMLEDIGFSWDPNLDRWDENYAVLKEYVEVYGELPKQRDKYKGVSIGTWLSCQKKKIDAKIKGHLTEEQKQKLLVLGVNLSVSKYMETWLKSYALYIEYKELYNEEPRQKVRYKGRDLGTWMWNQRSYLKDGTLPPERVKLLADIGIKN
ncbi:MAG: Helicase associated domain protein [Alphaproteobacteria bacterium]|nr:Helicase associated domain protein [Alphaproteobacteria bacterium]